MNSVHSRKGHLMETMIERMEQYNKNLENIVEDRTKDYLEEKRKVRIFFSCKSPTTTSGL